MAEGKAEQQRQGSQGPTPGELLAARKAAKAAKKAAKRGRAADVRESEAIRAATLAADWARQNRRVLWSVIGAAVVLIGGVTAWSYWSTNRSEKAANLLWEGARAADAPLGGGLGASGSDQETFTTVDARAHSAARRFDRVIERYSGAAAAPWARLGRANALLQEGKPSEARKLFHTVLQDADSVVLKWRALDGLAQSYEAQKSWLKAMSQYRAMASLNDRRIEMAARFGMARMELAEGRQKPAIEALKDLRSDLNKEGAPQLPELSQATDELLSYLDPEAVPAASTGAGSQFTPEQLRELIKRLKAQHGAGGAGGPGGAGQ